MMVLDANASQSGQIAKEAYCVATKTADMFMKVIME
jgi:hypothetical protein